MRNLQRVEQATEPRCCVSGLLVIALSVSFLTSCAISSAVSLDQNQATELDEPSAVEKDTESDDIEWWVSFNDPLLNEVVDEVLAANHDILMAMHRLNEAKYTSMLVSSNRWPTINPSATANESDTPTNASLGQQLNEFGLKTEELKNLGVEVPERLALSTYAWTGQFGYEVDLAGKWRKSHSSAKAMENANEWDLHAATVWVIAEAISSYYESVFLQIQLSLHRELIVLLSEQQEHDRRQFEAGLIDAPTWYQSQRRTDDVNSQLPSLEIQLIDVEDQLLRLMASTRSDVAHLLPSKSTTLPTMSETPSLIPADLLHQRPDVNAAREKVASAHLNLEAEKASRLPSLTFDGSIGLRAGDVSQWFDASQWFQNISVNLLAPMFPNFKNRARDKLAELQLSIALDQYQFAVIRAVNEVESVIQRQGLLKQRREYVSSVLEAADQDVQIKRQEYEAGIASFSELTLAEDSYLRAAINSIRAQRDLLKNQLSLHRAVAGKWVRTENRVGANSHSQGPEKPEAVLVSSD